MAETVVKKREWEDCCKKIQRKNNLKWENREHMWLRGWNSRPMRYNNWHNQSLQDVIFLTYNMDKLPTCLSFQKNHLQPVICKYIGNWKIMDQMLTWKQGRTLVLHSSNASITVRLRLKHSPHVFSMNERQHTQVHHVPRRAVVVVHKVEGHGNVGMAVIKTKIVLLKKKCKKLLLLYE